LLNPRVTVKFGKISGVMNNHAN